MQRTIFTTPGINHLLRGVSVAFLRLTGWKIRGALPLDAQRCVLIAAPHTSNWDLPYTLMVAFTLRLNIHWMGKSELFRGWRGPIMRWLGGLSVNREQSSNMVLASALALEKADGPLQLVVPPEGTRARVREWKTGFYWIARTARVPIVLAYMDYERKISGLGPVMVPSGNLEADMVVIKDFYAPFKGRNPDQFEAG